MTQLRAAPRGVLIAGAGVVVIVAAAWLVSPGAIGSRSASALGTATTPDSAGRPSVLVQDPIDTKPIGSDPAWEIAGARADAGIVTVAPVPTSVDRSVRVRLAAAGETYTACRAFSAVARGVLLAEAVVLVDGFGRGATTVASVHAGGNEVAGLRIGPGGEVQVRAEDARAAATALMPGVWYDVLFELDVAAGTYRLAVSRHGQQAAPVSEQTGVRWSGAIAGGLDRFCVAPPSGIADRSIYVSDLRVTSR